MALPASGQISASDIRSELQLNISNFSFALAAYENYVPLNAYSSAIPPNTGQVDMSDWYSYCHSCSENCGATTFTVVGAQYVKIDLGTDFGRVDFSGSNSGCYGCLKKGTEILSDNLEKLKIEELSVGQKIFNGVDYNFIKSFDEVISDKLYVFNDGLIETSESHNHYIQNSFGVIEIITSDEVSIGDNFIKVDGTLIPIYKIEIKHGNFELINIGSSGNQLYVANEIITHNKCSCGWSIYSQFPYNSSGTFTGTSSTQYATGDTYNSTFSGSFNYTSLSGRYAYCFGLCSIQTTNFVLNCPVINLYWSFSQGADSGTFEIQVNSVQFVYQTSTSSGNITVAFGDVVDVFVSSTTSGGFVADATTSIVEDNTQVCSDNQTGFPTAYSNCTRTVAGYDLEVYGTAAQV